MPMNELVYPKRGMGGSINWEWGNCIHHRIFYWRVEGQEVCVTHILAVSTPEYLNRFRSGLL